MTIRSRFIAAALLNLSLLLPLTAVFGADMPVDPAVGTWTLNLAKSKLDPSEPALKSSVRNYTATPDGLKVAIHSVDADGTAHDTGSTFSYDGKQHPVMSAMDYDTIAVMRVGTNETKTDLIKSGKVVGHLTRVVSKDGKIHEVTVYDRQ